MLNQNILRQRVRRFLEELDIPITKFAKKNGFSREAYYKWQREDLTFSDAKAAKIDSYLKMYGF